MRVFAVPRSIARSFENRPWSQSKFILSLLYREGVTATPWSALVRLSGSWRGNRIQRLWVPRRESTLVPRAETASTPRPRGRRPHPSASTLGNLALFVREVLPAHRAEFLQLELLGHKALVLCRRVVCTTTIAAGHLDDVTHWNPNRLAGNGAGREEYARVWDSQEESRLGPCS